MDIVNFINQLKDSHIDLSLIEDDLEISYDGEDPPDSVLNEIRHNKTGIVNFLKKITRGRESAIPVAPPQENYAVSFSQRRLWGLCQLEDGNRAYNIPGAYILEGKPDLAALEYALNALVARHEILRTVFMEDGQGEVRQIIHPPGQPGFNLTFEDIRSDAERDLVLKNRIGTAMMTPFDLRSGPLLRAGLYRLSADKWVFVYVIHHIICDGRSEQVLMKELLLLHNAYIKGAGNPLRPLKFQYKDYTIWQREQVGNDPSGAHRSYWLRQLEGELPVLDLPCDKPRPAIKTYHGALISFRIDARISNGLRSLCLDQDSTLFMGLMGIVNVLLYRYTGQEDIIIGTPIAGRDRVELEDQIGFYANTLALRTRFGGNDNYRDILEKVKQVTLGAYEHQLYPFDVLVDELQPRRDLSRNPLFDVMVVLQNTKFGYVNDQQQFDGINISVYQNEQPPVSRFDLSLYFVERGEEIEVSLEYNNDIYAEVSMERLGRHMVRLMEKVVASPSLPVGQLDYMTPEEKLQLLVHFNDTEMPFPDEKTLIALFEEQVALTPDRIAIVAEEERISYIALNGMANQLAYFLRQHYGIKPENLVAIKLERSKWLIVAILGVLKSGGAYVPVDPEYPEERIDYILTDSKVKLLIDEQELDKFIKERHTWNTGNISPVNRAGDPAYVIYTSGSTGRPKGCLLEQRGIINRIVWMWEHYGFDAEDIILQKTAFTFDVSVWEIFMPLCRGARMVLCRKEDARSPERILSLIVREQVTCLHFVPGMLNAFIASVSDQTDISLSLKSLRKVFTSGEALPLETIRLWYNKVNVPVHNLYGPTEASVDVTYYATSSQDSKIPIGRPIWNTQIYIVDRTGLPVPIGVRGEICIGGTGLARGYLNKTELTRDKFVANPFREGTRMYKTGDLGRWLPDGNVEFLGRIDDQVKIHGYRIEPGDVECALQRHQDVDAAIVAVKTDNSGEKNLVAYVVSTTALDVAALRSFIGKLLPAYMQPGYYVRIEKLPLGPNGKIDRRQLPDPEGLAMATGVAYVPPGNDTERRLVKIWEELLGRSPIGIKDNFFDLGGHSLKATRLATRISRAFHIKISLHHLFEAPVLEEQVKFIQQAGATTFSAIPSAVSRRNYPLSFSQRRLWVLCQFEDVSRAYNLHGEFVFEGDLDVEALEYALHSLIVRHEILRTVFREDEQGEIRQYIYPAEEIRSTLLYEDLRNAGKEGEMLNHKVRAEVLRPFDLATGPLLRAGLYRVAGNRWVFVYIMHHIISDGWSLDILERELLLLYNARIKGLADLLAPLEIQYKDYAIWQREQWTDAPPGADLNDHRSYWLEQFKGELPVLELPADKPRPAVKTHEGAIANVRFAPGIRDGLQSLCRQERSTLFMGLLAAVNVLLYKYTGHEDVIIGSPIAGRDHIDLAGQIGFYANTLALRTRFSGGDSYKSLLKNVRNIALGAFEHQAYPFDRLLDELRLERDRSRNYLFDVLVHVHDARDPAGDRRLGGLSVVPYNEETHVVSKFDLSFTFTVSDSGLSLFLEYSTDLFNEATIQRMCGHLECLLGSILSSPDLPLDELNYLTGEERNRLLVTFNHAPQNYEGYKALTTLIGEQATLQPDRIALKSRGGLMTYKELDQRSHQLAHHLVNDLGVRPGARIGIMVDRSATMIIAILGILRSGGAYIPLEPDYPAARKKYILQDAGISLLLTQEKYLPGPGSYEGTIVDIDARLKEPDTGMAPPEVVAEPDSLAYVIYTSGSSGMPKGCAITHGSLSNYIQWANNYYFGDSCRASFGLFTALSFDLTVTSIFCPLTQGGMLTIYDPEAQLPGILADNFSEESGINCIKLTPSHINLLKHLNLSSRTALRVIVGGEQVTPGQVSILKKIHPCMEIYNEYGPTETTVGCTVARLEEGMPIIIGRPAANTFVYILKGGHELCATGVAGEICIGGSGLARGYMNNPELTAAKFVGNPFRRDERMYRTGDLGKWLPDGNIVYIGRKDDQVKIRGYRIEPGEIERTLQNHEKIDAAVILVRTNASAEKELVAYIVGKEELLLSDLRSYLALHLPAYMLPAHFVQLAQLPLTPNGKVDKRRLPDPEGLTMPADTPYLSPRNEIEEHLVSLWQELLGRKGIGVKDDFFNLGAHSLHVLRLASHIYSMFHVKISLKELFRNMVLEDLAVYIQQAKKIAFLTINPAPVQAGYPLSSSQRRIWTVSQMENETIAYNMPGVYLFEGELNTDAWESSFRTLIERHESLRTAFRKDEHTGIRQIILPAEEMTFEIAKYDLRDEEKPEERVNSIVKKESLKPFDLTSAPLIRASLLQLAVNKWVFSYVVHHIVCDGWSLKILVKELLSLYNAKCQGIANPLPALRIQFKDYAAWQQQQLTGEAFKEHRDYWLSQFKEELPVLDLPGDKMRPAIKSNNGGAVKKMIGVPSAGGLKAIVRRQGSTLFMGVLAIVRALLYRYTSQKDLIIGTQVAGRDHIDLEQQIGPYLNTLALRVQLEAGESFLDVLEKVKQAATGAYAYQEYPFDVLIEELHLQRDMSRNPLFDVAVALENNDTAHTKEEKGPDALHISEYTRTIELCKFDLAFHFMERGDEMEMIIVYNNDIYAPSTIDRMGNHLLQLLDVALADPGSPIGQLDYLSPKEVQQLSDGFNISRTDYPEDKTIVHLFNEQVLRTPDNPALVFEDKELSYKMLDERANRLANYLLVNHQVRPNDLVAVMLDRSTEMIIAILAILKTGGAYLPIDPEFPSSRIEYLLKDSGAGVLLTASPYLHRIRAYEGSALAIDTIPDGGEAFSGSPAIRVCPGDLAYVIYTSGSTGHPKGVMINHESLVDYCFGIMSRSNIRDCTHFGMVSTIAADLGNTILYTSLLTGGTLHIYSAAALLDAEKIFNGELDCIKIVPSHWKSLQRADKVFLPAKCLIFGGEQLTPEVLETIRRSDCRCEVYNHYGPTETTIGKLIKHIEFEHVTYPIPLGSPFCNSTFYILDEQEKLTPPGIIGEICIGGVGLARGYINRPEHTAQKFVQDPFKDGGRMYRTGDLGRWLIDGTIEYFGRKDDQVKIRGYRVELGEIESTLRRHPDIDSTFVRVRSDNDGEKELIAYIVNRKSVGFTDLKAWLALTLPGYMLPSHFVGLEQLPLTPNGKVDRKRLPEPEGTNMPESIGYIAPTNNIEKILAGIWEELLAKEKIGIKDDYFVLGGNSLKVIGILKRMMDETGVAVPVNVFFQGKTIQNIARYIAGRMAKPADGPDGPVPASRGSEGLCEASYNQLTFLSGWKLGSPLVITPYEFESLDLEAFRAAVNQLIDRHEILRTKFVRTGSAIMQEVLAAGAFKFEIADPVRLSSGEDLELIIQKAHSRNINPFSFPLMIVELFLLPGGSCFMLVTMHHLITDGYSDGVLRNDLMQLYSAILKKEPPVLEPLSSQYKDFSKWQRDFVRSAEGLRHRAYWLKKLQGHSAEFSMAPGEAIRDFDRHHGKSICVTRIIDEDFYEEIDLLTKRNGLTRPAFLIGGLMIVASRLSSREDVSLLVTVSGRNSRYYGELDFAGLIGYFANSLIVRNRVPAEMPAIEFLLQVQQDFLDDLSHDTYPIEKLIHELPGIQPATFLSKRGAFNYHNYAYLNEHTYKVKEAERTGVIEYKAPVQTPFGLVVKEYKNCLKLEFIFDHRRFAPSRAFEMNAFYLSVLQQIIDEPGKFPGQLTDNKIAVNK